MISSIRSPGSTPSKDPSRTPRTTVAPCFINLLALPQGNRASSSISTTSSFLSPQSRYSFSRQAIPTSTRSRWNDVYQADSGNHGNGHGGRKGGGNHGRGDDNNDPGEPYPQPVLLSFFLPILDLIFPTKTKKKVLILMSDTGGGHRASAQALQAAFEQYYKDEIDIKIVDMFVEIAGRPFDKFPEGYSYAAKHPILWQMMFSYAGIPIFKTMTEHIVYSMMGARMRHYISKEKPDLILSVHPLCQEIPLRVLRHLGMREQIKFVTVVTDLGGAHSTWFHKDVDALFVPSQAVYKLARKCQVDEGKIHMVGLPVRKQFWSEPRQGKRQMRRMLNMDVNAPATLIIGGGDGVGSLKPIAIQMAKTLHKDHGSHGAQMVVICGKNKALKDELDNVQWPIPVQIKGFVSNMSEYMHACDNIVTKAGPGTIAEALTRSLPIVISGYLPGQEYGNVGYVVNQRVGMYSKDPAVIGKITSQWFSNPKQLKDLSARAHDLGRPRSTLEIAHEIHSLLVEQQ